MAATPEQTHSHSEQPPQQPPPPPEAEYTHPHSEQTEAEYTHPHSEQPPQQPPPPPEAEYTHPHSEQPPQQPPPPEAEDTHPHSEQPPQQPSRPEAEDTKKWGTHIMGTPAAPNVHPDNQQAAQWKAADHQQIPQQQPYVQHSPIDKHTNNPFEPVIQAFNSWSAKAETMARNIWYNLKAGHSVPEAAWGKVNLTAKALSGGGFESLFKQIFETDPNEKLKKTFACYLSTSTGPVAGTQYLSTARLAFCSDRPLTFTSPSLGNISTVNPVVTKENPPEKYIQIATTDGHEFWFMGFVNFDKASHHIFESVADFRTAGNAVQQVQPVPG